MEEQNVFPLKKPTPNDLRGQCETQCPETGRGNVERALQHSSVSQDCVTKTLTTQEINPKADKLDLRTLKKFCMTKETQLSDDKVEKGRNDFPANMRQEYSWN